MNKDDEDKAKLEEKIKTLEKEIKVSETKIQNLYVLLQGTLDQSWITAEKEFGIEYLAELSKICEQIELPLYDKDIDRVRCLLKLVCNIVLGEIKIRSKVRITEPHFE